MSFVEDRAPFYADFGIAATLNGAAVTGIFDDSYGEAFGGLIAGSGPMFRLSSSAGHAAGQSLVIGSVTYTVTEVKPDGTGETVLRLDKA